MKDRLKSRKWWITTAAILLVAFAKQLGIDIAPETIWQLVALVTGYNASQAMVDRAKASMPE